MFPLFVVSLSFLLFLLELLNNLPSYDTTRLFNQADIPELSFVVEKLYSSGA